MDDLRQRALASPPAPAVERPGAGTENRKRQEAAGHREVLPEVDRLIRAEVKKERSQETESEKRQRRSASLQANEHEQSAAEFGRDHERQQPGVDAIRLHIFGDAGVLTDIGRSRENENVCEHDDEHDPPGEAPQEDKVRVVGAMGRRFSA
jgi:hypothetical protein